MGYLNNIMLNSNTYSVGAEIKKLNLNGTIYTLGLDTSDATLTSEWQLSEGITAYSNAKKYTGVVKDHATVGKMEYQRQLHLTGNFIPILNQTILLMQLKLIQIINTLVFLLIMDIMMDTLMSDLNHTS